MIEMACGALKKTRRAKRRGPRSPRRTEAQALLVA